MRYKLLFLLLLITNVAFGQTDSTKTYYCEVYCQNSGLSKFYAYLDFGDREEGGAGPLSNVWRPVDNNGEYISFKSTANIINWMSERGWKVIQQNYYKAVSSEIYILLMSKSTSSNNIKENIRLKGDK